jgi:nitrate reductase NapAB chaperone NapD
MQFASMREKRLFSKILRLNNKEVSLHEEQDKIVDFLESQEDLTIKEMTCKRINRLTDKIEKVEKKMAKVTTQFNKEISK